MKKTFSVFAVVLSMLMTTALISCEKQGGEQGGPEGPVNPEGPIIPDAGDTLPESETVAVDYLGCSYFGDEFKNGTHNFWFGFKTGSIQLNDATREVSGTGEIFYVDLISPTANNVFPRVGTYEINSSKRSKTVLAGYMHDFGVDAGMEPGIDVSPLGTYIENWKDGKVIEKEDRLIVAGTVVVEGTKGGAIITLNAVFADGTKGRYRYTGALDINDTTADQGGDQGGDTGGDQGGDLNLSYEWEPVERTDNNITFTYAELGNYGDLLETGTDNIEIYLESDQWLADLIVFAKPNSDSAVGKYEVTNTYEVGTCMLSEGGDSEGDLPSYFGTGFDAEGYYTESYYVTSGMVEVTDNGISFDFKTFNGSTLKGTYKGITNLVDVVYAPGNKICPMMSYETKKSYSQKRSFMDRKSLRRN